jgi:uncharacterized protein (TIGR03435 family)
MLKARLLGAVGIVAVVGGIAVLTAQTPRSPAFEAASVKQNKSGDSTNFVRVQPGGRFTATNMTLRSLVAFAFGASGQRLPGFQLAGGPNWIDTDRFDIVAKAPDDPAPGATGPAPEMLAMARALLTERFKLTVHHEARELPVYALVIARSDGRTGPQLQPVAVDCVAQRAAQRAALGNVPPPSLPPIAPCSIGQFPGTWTGLAVTMSQVANALQGDRLVVDRTGLNGQFDFRLSFTPDQIPSQTPPPGAPLCLRSIRTGRHSSPRFRSSSASNWRRREPLSMFSLLTARNIRPTTDEA